MDYDEALVLNWGGSYCDDY